MSLEALKKQATALINKNVNNIDSRSIGKFYKIANPNLKANKYQVEHLINFLKTLEADKNAPQNNTQQKNK